MLIYFCGWDVVRSLPLAVLVIINPLFLCTQITIYFFLQHPPTIEIVVYYDLYTSVLQPSPSFSTPLCDIKICFSHFKYRRQFVNSNFVIQVRILFFKLVSLSIILKRSLHQRWTSNAVKHPFYLNISFLLKKINLDSIQK